MKTDFLGLPSAAPHKADVILLPLPFEGTVSYGRGTARGPEAILSASAQVELWDEELDFDLSGLQYHTAEFLSPRNEETAGHYLQRVTRSARLLQHGNALLVGLGGEHSLTPALVEATAGEDLSQLTVVQFDAHADLRSEYEGTPFSHACAMRRIVAGGGGVLAIGIRSADRDEFRYGQESGRVTTFFAHQLADNPAVEEELCRTLNTLQGDVYLTIDIDALEVCYCPATGTPQPGGLHWWAVLRYLRSLLRGNRQRGMRLLGCDIVETVPQQQTRVNEFTAARLLCKVLAYHFAAF